MCLEESEINAREMIDKAVIFPTFPQIYEFAEKYAEVNSKIFYHNILSRFEKLANLESYFTLQSIKEACIISKYLKNAKLSLEDSYIFSHSPTHIKSLFIMNQLKNMAINLKSIAKVPLKLDYTENSSLEFLEDSFNLCELYT